MLRITLVLFACLIAFSTAPTAAQDVLPRADATFAVYGTSGPWTVYADRSRDTCLAERLYNNGEYAMQVGSTKDASLGYLGVFSVTTDRKVVRKQKVRLDVDGRVFKSTATGARHQRLKNEYRGGYIKVKDRALADALMVGRFLYVTPARSDPFMFDITGLGDAVQLTIRCIQSQ